MAPPLTWAHGCNSVAQLDAALAAPSVDALEVDFGWNAVLQDAVTKHAALSEDGADELASAFVERLFRAEAVARIRVLKLDFKSVRAMAPTLAALQRCLDELEARAGRQGAAAQVGPEVWINGDILDGPGGRAAVPNSRAGPPLDVEAFFAACEAWPRATLSVGWTTDFWVTREMPYTDAHVDAMLQVLGKHRKGRPVTFPIRASLFRCSWGALRRLLDAPDTSLTLWTSVEGVPQEDLDWAAAELREDQLVVDCDKGPRLPFHHPGRLYYYAAHVLGVTFGWGGH